MTRQLVLFLLFVCPFTAVADSSVDREAAALFESVMSPYCPGRTLSACPSEDARVLRDELRGELEQGKSPDTIRHELLERFANLGGKPSGERSGTLAAAGLGIFFLLGLFMLTRMIKPVEGSDAEEES